jgi:NurA domain
MLYTQKLLAELQAKAPRFAGFQSDYDRTLDAYREALAALSVRFASAQTIADALGRRLANEPAGALATAEYEVWHRRRLDGQRTLPVLPFGRVFAHHEESRAWAECLRGVTTFAVDGSQLLPWRDASIPLALVQVGLYENPHRIPASYVKDVALELLTPDDLLGDAVSAQPGERDAPDAGSDDELPSARQVASEEAVHLRRFELEARTLVTRMEHHAAARDAGTTDRDALIVGFLDGSLIVSFALKMSPAYRHAYVTAAREVLRASERWRIPLVAYIDTSYARDVVTMLRRLSLGDGTSDTSPLPLPEPRAIHDALLWRGAMAWGDRTPAFLSARGDLLESYGEQRDAVAFVYFQAALDRPPARLEFPRWMLEAGLLGHVLDVVRAEVIVGGGYPYALETADQVAVIQAPDRAKFYEIFQQFAARNGLSFTFSRKALSKSRRRL